MQLLDVPGVRLSLLVSAAVGARCAALRRALGAAAQLPPALQPSTARLEPYAELSALLGELRAASTEHGAVRRCAAAERGLAAAGVGVGGGLVDWKLPVWCGCALAWR